MSESDVGFAAERTHLSWRRTILSALVVVLLAVSKVVVTSPTPAAVLIVCLMILSWLAIVLIARRRLAALRDGRRVPVSTSPALVALLVAGYAILAAILIIKP
jgi:uncharacterized membrane protein YidH (DUF202 family)